MTAKKALDHLLAFGLSKAEIASRIGRKVGNITAIHDASEQAMDLRLTHDLVNLVHTEARQRGRKALKRLRQLRVPQKALAVELEYNESTISRAGNEKELEWPLGPDLALALIRKLAIEEDMRATEDSARVTLNVLDTCPDLQTKIHFDEQFNSNLVRAFRAALKGALTNSVPSEALLQGCLGALASVGPPALGLYVMLLRSADVGTTDFGQESKSLEARHLRVLVHELLDLIHRLQMRIGHLEESAYKPEGAF